MFFASLTCLPFQPITNYYSLKKGAFFPRQKISQGLLEVTKTVVLLKVKHIYWFDMQRKNWLLGKGKCEIISLDLNL